MPHDHHHHDHFHFHAEGNARLMKLATMASVGMATCLLLAKLVAWWRSDSLAMLSSATDSFFDVMSSVLNLVAVRYALKPADDDHRFGHTSIEDIAGLAQCAFISASMFIIILQSLERLSNPVTLHHAEMGIWVSIIGMLVTTALVAYQTYVTRKTKSLIVHADRLHYAGDIAFNAGVLVAMVLTIHFGWGWADPVMALLIAAVVLWSSRGIGIRAFNNLMDREMPEEEKQKIHAAAAAIEGIRGYHNLKTRYAGGKAFIQMHIEMDGSLGFRAAHDITDRLESELQRLFPHAEVIVHPDPADVREERLFPAQF